MLAPAAFMTKATHPAFYLAKYAGKAQWLLHRFGIYEVLPHYKFLSWIGRTLCDEDLVPYDVAEICDQIMDVSLNINPELLNK